MHIKITYFFDTVYSEKVDQKQSLPGIIPA